VFACARDDQRMVRSNFSISEFWDGQLVPSVPVDGFSYAGLRL
jgi:hypothetical protein